MSEERRRILHNLDRIEDRLRDAPVGLHDAGPPADPAALAASGLDPDLALLWGEYDGLELGGGEVRIYPLAEHPEATRAALESGRVRPGDRVIGERGRDLFVLAADPHAEGADVILVEEDGERLPYASSVDRLVLALLGEFSVLFDQDGEYQADLFGDDGELTSAAERRLLRRHLDFDPDAPLARFRLAQSLRRAGQLRGADAELRQLLRRAPDFLWAHLELGRVRMAEHRPADAAKSLLRAAELAAEPGLRAHCLALACLAQKTASSAQELSASSDPDQKPAWARTAAAVLEANPTFAAAQEAAVRDALEGEDLAAADEQLALGLAVVPGHLGLLALRPAVAELRARLAAAPPDEEPEDDPDADLDPALLDDEAERLAAHKHAPAQKRESAHKHNPAQKPAHKHAPAHKRESAHKHNPAQKPAHKHAPAPKRESAHKHKPAPKSASAPKHKPEQQSASAHRRAPAPGRTSEPSDNHRSAAAKRRT
ncbi:MAG TPA: hypothetical protein VIK91_00760 [Nannocystis sp.]